MMWGREHRDKELARRFVAALNARDVEAAGALMSEDFTYYDSLRDGLSGRAVAMRGLSHLFARDAAVALEVEDVGGQHPFVLMRGTISSARLGGKRRAVWRARCEGGKLQEWRSWAEGDPNAASDAPPSESPRKP